MEDLCIPPHRPSCAPTGTTLCLAFVARVGTVLSWFYAIYLLVAPFAARLGHTVPDMPPCSLPDSKITEDPVDCGCRTVGAIKARGLLPVCAVAMKLRVLDGSFVAVPEFRPDGPAQ